MQAARTDGGTAGLALASGLAACATADAPGHAALAPLLLQLHLAVAAGPPLSACTPFSEADPTPRVAMHSHVAVHTCIAQNAALCHPWAVNTVFRPGVLSVVKCPDWHC